jgi:hypothetical protein
MNNTRRGLPLTRAHVEQIFPKLTPIQIRRITARGHTRAIQRGEVLYEQGVTDVPFFVVVSGELEIVRPLGPGAVETLVFPQNICLMSETTRFQQSKLGASYYRRSMQYLLPRSLRRIISFGKSSK